jgi:hypothetical protein
MPNSYAARIDAEAPTGAFGMPTVSAAAREYAAAGWSFIPIHAPVPGDTYRDGKHPATDGGEWLAYTKQDSKGEWRRPKPEEIDYWFPAGVTSNIGIICGQVSEGLVVIDCDDPATYAALCYRYPELRSSRTVRTGKGFHIYCYADEPVKTTKFTLNGSTHHIKAEGSYVVAPPSVHASGRRYEWVADVPLVTLDLERLRSVLVALGATGSGRSVAEGEPIHARGWAATLLREGAKQGERDDLTFQLAASLIKALPYDTTLAILELWAQYRCAQTPDPWGAADVEAKLRSVVKYEQGSS